MSNELLSRSKGNIKKPVFFVSQHVMKKHDVKPIDSPVWMKLTHSNKALSRGLCKLAFGCHDKATASLMTLKMNSAFDVIAVNGFKRTRLILCLILIIRMLIVNCLMDRHVIGPLLKLVYVTVWICSMVAADDFEETS